MKKLIAALFISFWYMGNLSAQEIKVVDATVRAWDGADFETKPVKPPPHGANYTITLYCQNPVSIVLDSIYMENYSYKLAQQNVYLDSLHTYTIHLSYSSRNPLPIDASNNSMLLNNAAIVLYEYNGTKHSLHIQLFTRLQTMHIK